MASYDVIGWDEFQRRFKWSQSEHLIACAPTGGGKTTLFGNLLPMRSHVVMLGTKSYDDNYRRWFTSQGYERIERWPPPRNTNRVLLWPKLGKTITETLVIQQRVFRDALNQIFRQGKWTLYIDELHWLCQNLNLVKECQTFHHQGRSSYLTLCDGFQRPAWVPVVSYSSATHAFLFKTTWEDDRKRLRLFAGGNPREFEANLMDLGDHEFIYVNTRKRQFRPIRSQVRL